MKFENCLVLFEEDIPEAPEPKNAEVTALLGATVAEQRAAVVLFVRRDGQTRLLKNRYGVTGPVAAEGRK